MSKCVFLDRDGVINVDNVDYTYKVEEFKIIEGVVDGLKLLKKAGYLLVIITNQSGIAKGIYGHEDVKACHDYLQQACGGIIDKFYYSPYHQTSSDSLSRKPDTLMFEKAIAKFNIDIKQSWMIGDRERDMIPAQLVGLKTILLPETEDYQAKSDYRKKDLFDAANFIIQSISY